MSTRSLVFLLLIGCKIGRNSLPPCDVVVTVVDEAGNAIEDATATLDSGEDCLVGCSFFEDDADEAVTVEAPGYVSFTRDIGYFECPGVEVELAAE